MICRTIFPTDRATTQRESPERVKPTLEINTGTTFLIRELKEYVEGSDAQCLDVCADKRGLNN